MTKSPPLVRRVTAFFQKDIWQPAYLTDTSFRGRFYAVLRIVSITVSGLETTRATSRAAALSFGSMLGLGPLTGLAVLIAGFAIGKNDPNLVAHKLNDLIQYVAPQLGQLEQIENRDRELSSKKPAAPSTSNASASKVAVNPQLVDLINTFIAGTRSSTAGAWNIISLIVIVLILFTSVEQTFNDIWGVRRGRSWLVRIVSYWAILTLGAVLFFGAIGALSLSAFISFFREHLPFGSALADVLILALPSLSLVLVIAVLTLFYRFIPNTRVFWRAAFSGAVTVAALLVLNNFLAFSYVRRVDLTHSLYGSLAILAVLTFGLYIFWFIVLIGGQLSYAVQNVHFRNSQAAWGGLTEAVRERLTLTVFLSIGRRFQGCMPPCTASELSNSIKVPTQVLNEALNRLVDLKLVSPIPPSAESSPADFLYQPARPLSRITLGDFKHLFENYGDDPAGDTLDRLDPLIARYHAAVDNLSKQELFTKNLEILFAE